MTEVTELMGTAAAAAYLDMPIATLKYHVTKGHIRPLKIGRTLLFTAAQLDEFAAQPRRPGPKPKPKD